MNWLEIYLYLAGIAVYLILMDGELEKDLHAQWFHKVGFYGAAVLWFLIPLVRLYSMAKAWRRK